MRLGLAPNSKVLVVHTWGIGDWIMFTPTLQAIKEQRPLAVLDVLVGTPSTAPIVQQYEEVRSVYQMDVRASYATVLHAALAARFRDYDYLIFTAGVKKQKARLFSLLAGGQRLVVASPSDPDDKSASKGSTTHRVAQNLGLLASLGLKVPSAPRPYLKSRWSHPTPRSVLIHPGCDARRPYKRWPPDRFVAVAHALRSAEVKVTILLGPSELPLQNIFQESAKSSLFSVVVSQSFDDAIQRISAHSVCLTSDSGLGHIAGALGRHVVTIFGPADPKIVSPMGEHCEVVQVTDDRPPCMPCMRIGGRWGCEAKPCLAGVSVDQVLRAVMRRIGDEM